MDGADQNDAEPDPQQTRKPAKRLASENRTGDGAGGGNSGKMLAEKIERLGGNEVDSVVNAASRSGARIVKLELTATQRP